MKSRNKKKIKVFDGYRCIYPYIRSKWKRMMSNAINEDDDKSDISTKQIYKKVNTQRGIMTSMLVEVLVFGNMFQSI